MRRIRLANLPGPTVSVARVRGARTAQAVLALPLLLVLACGPAPRRAALVVGVEQEPASLDPRLGSDVAADRAFRLLYRGLFTIGPDFKPVPDLVHSWTEEDPTHYRFTLKRGVRFSDGREVTARDAAFTLRSILRPDMPSFRKGDLERIASVDATDRYALVVTLKEPFAAFLSALNVGVVPDGTPPNPDHPVGCGPYRLRRWIPGQWLLFEANPYARPAPAEPTIAFKVIPDPVVRALEMRRGSVDLVVNDLPPDTLAWFLAHGYPVHRVPGASYAYIGLNCARGPLRERAVRQALAYAVNRNALIASIERGFARPATGMLCPEHWAYCGDVATYAYDPGRARRLLDEAGFPPGPDGVRFRLSYKTSQNKVSQQIATAVAQDLARVGVGVDLQSLEWGTFYGDVKRGDFDCFGLTWVGVTDPDGYRLRFSSGALPPDGFNRGRYADPGVDELLAAGARESDERDRRQVYAQVQKILAQDVPYVSLWWPDAVCVTQKDVEDVHLPADGNFSFLARVRRREARAAAVRPDP